MKRAMKYISFLLVFTLLAVGTTYLLIRRSEEPTAEELPEVEITPEAGIDLNGFYDQNHLTFTEVIEDLGEDRQAMYLQIDGLKNAEAEQRINDAIAAEAAALKDSFGGDRLNYMTCYEYGNFSNVLSLNLFAGDLDYNYRSVNLNFNLNDGSELRLEDIFGAQADLLGIVRSAFYEELTGYNFTEDYWETAQSPDENELYRVVSGYMSGEDKEFFFSPTQIFFIYDDYTASIDMVDHAEDITLYHKFLTEESLFEREDIGYKNIFTCAEIPDAYEIREFGYAGENLWYDFGYEGVYLPDGTPQEAIEGISAYADGMLDAVRGEIEGLRQEAGAHPDTMYIYIANPTLQPHIRIDYSDGEGWQAAGVSKAVAYSGHTKLYTMPKALFDTKYRQLMVETYRKEPHYLLFEGLDNAIDNDVQRKRDDSEKLYRWDTGEQVTADTLFAEGYDHAGFVRAYVIDELVRYHGYSLGDAELAAQDLWYEVEGEGLHIGIPGWGDERFLWLPLTQFAPSRLTIFA